jgi:hydrogenase maturation factor
MALDMEGCFMARRFWAFSLAVAFLLLTTWVEANFSTSIMKPTPVGANGVISASFPTSGQKGSYYFSVNVQKGELLTQISFDGRDGANKQVELALLNSSARVEDSYWIHGSDAIEEATRSFPMDSAGKRVLRLTVQGPETGGFRVEIGGSAFVGSSTPAAFAQESIPQVAPSQPQKMQDHGAASGQPTIQSLVLSTAAQSPTPIPATGLVNAPFPTTKTYYYFAADAQPGELLTQISYQGRQGADKELELALLKEDGKAADWYWIHGSDAVEEATRVFFIDKGGLYVLRIATQGPETGHFRVEFGGVALSSLAPKTPLIHHGFSKSVFAPTPVDENGVIAGPLPGTETKTVYYFEINAQPGELLTQISYEGREGVNKALTLNLLGKDARVAQWYWIHGSDAREEATRSLPIDTAGHKLLRVEVMGPATGVFRIELGGPAFAGSSDSKKSSLTTSQANF